MKPESIIVLCLYSLLIIALIAACVSVPKIEEDNSQDKIFLDFAKYEDLYRSGVIYYPWVFDNIDSPNRFSNEKIKLNPSEIKKRILKNIFFEEDYDGNLKINYNAQIPLPHYISFNKIKENIYKAEAQVAVPQSVGDFEFTANEIGITKSFDNLHIKLLEIKDNEAVFFIRDMGIKYDYSYTKDDYIDDENEEDENSNETETKADEEFSYDKMLEYERKYDISRRGYSLSYRVNEKPNELFYKTNKIHAVVHGTGGEDLNFESFSADFRHYLWYRNMDMPYPWLAEYFYDIKERYIETENHEKTEYHPFFIAKLRAAGKIKSVSLSVLSDKIKKHKIDLDFLNVEENKRDGQSGNTERQKEPAYQNYTAEELEQKIKIEPYSLHIANKQITLSAFFPLTANTQDFSDASISLNDIRLIDSDGNLYEIGDAERSDIEGILLINNPYIRHTASYSIPIVEPPFKVLCNVEFSYPIYKKNEDGNFIITEYADGEYPAEIEINLPEF